MDDCAAEPLLLDPAPGDQDHQDQEEQEHEGSDDDDYVDDKEG